MKNPEIETPNFIVLRKDVDSAGFCQVTICQRTLNIIHEEKLNEIPNDWSAKDFYDLLDEGNRFFNIT